LKHQDAVRNPASSLDGVRKYSAQDFLPIRRRVLKAPELWGGGFEAKANFPSAAMSLAEEHNSAVLFLAASDIPQDEPLAQVDWRRQSNETTMSTKYDSARRIPERGFIPRLALHHHGQLRIHSL
jgi:hypothetical protein